MKAKEAMRLLMDAGKKALESAVHDDESVFEKMYLIGFGNALSMTKDVMMCGFADGKSADDIAKILRDTAKGATLAVMLADPSVLAKILDVAAREAGEKTEEKEGDANEG
jgi:hypothetical protein